MYTSIVTPHGEPFSNTNLQCYRITNTKENDFDLCILVPQRGTCFNCDERYDWHKLVVSCLNCNCVILGNQINFSVNTESGTLSFTIILILNHKVFNIIEGEMKRKFAILFNRNCLIKVFLQVLLEPVKIIQH